MSYICLLLAILSTAFGQFFFKRYQLTKQYLNVITALGLFITTPMFSYCALREIPIDIVYVFTALTIFIVMQLSHYLLKEPISTNARFGSALIISGVIVYGID